MSDVPAAATRPRLTPRTAWLLALCVLFAYAVLALSASTQKGVSFDEGEQIAIGYNLWLRHDFRMESANGDLVKRWATLPLLLSRPTLPGTNDPSWLAGAPYVLGFRFLFDSGNPTESLLLQTRAMIAALGVALGLLVFLCSRSLFGWAGGLISVTVFAFSPHMLAFGAIVSTEISICLTLLGSTWCVWRLLHRVTWGTVALSLATFGLLLLAKPSALVILPITAVLLVVRFIVNRPLDFALGSGRRIVSRPRQALVFAALVAAHALAGWAMIWAHYEFRFAASPNPADQAIQFKQQPYIDPISPTTVSLLRWSRTSRLFPEGFIRGIKWLLGQDDQRPAFLHGEWKIGGWPRFFPYTVWVKSSPALEVLALTAAGGAIMIAVRRRRRKVMPGTEPPRDGSWSLYEATPFFALVLVYFSIAVTQHLNIGHRHVLPIYPPIYVLVGAAAWVWQARRRWWKAATVVPLGVIAAESLVLYPDYLAYFSPLVGGPAEGYTHLVDSSLDWGMDLPGLKRWLDSPRRDRKQPVYLAYFGTDSPEHHGIHVKRLPSFFDWRPKDVYPLAPGVYAISATLLQAVYTQPMGAWTPGYEKDYQRTLQVMQRMEAAGADMVARALLYAEHPGSYWDDQYAAFEKLRFARLCAWLRQHRKPDASIGYSILLWQLSAEDLQSALFGPAPEEGAGPGA